MDSNYLDLSKVPEALFHPMVKSQEEIFAFKAGYKPNDNIPPSLDFSKEEMMKVPSMAWMKNHNFILIAPNMPDNTYGTDISVQSSLLDWFKSIESGCSMFEAEKKERKLVALDLETTGLNTNIRIHGGQIVRFEDMVGVCISVDEKDGYYIPILHTEEDGVKNWSLSDVKELIDYLTDEEKFILTLHNAVYDFSIIRAHGMRIPKICTDTLILSKLMNNFEFYRYGVQNGLKQLSEYLLERKMVEIHSFFGHKDPVQFNLLSATTATCYASSDSIASISLHHYFVTNDVDGRNPWKYQPLNCIHYDSIITVKQFESSQPIKVKIGEAKKYEGWLVDSPDGWVRINKWLDQGVKDTIKLKFKDGSHLICTPDHKIETFNRGWVEAQHLTDMDDILTIAYSTKVVWITDNKPVNVYDITVDHDNHRFFANGKSLHNCHIVHKMIYHQVVTSQIGIPIDYDHTLKSLRTTIRRTILLERKWAVIQERHKKDYKISSNEQANIFVGDLLRENFFGASDVFDQWALETFMMKTKHVTVGKDDKARLKTTYGMDDSVMTLILKKLPSLDYSNEIKDAITDTLDILSLYRSLTHDLPSYTGLIRSAWRDDRGFVMGSGATRMEGTDCLIAGTPVTARVDGIVIETTMDALGNFCPTYIDGEEGTYDFEPFVELQCGIDEWVHVLCFVTKIKDTIEITTNRTKIGSAVRHRFMSNNSWIYAEDIGIGDRLQTIYGMDDKVIDIKPLPTQMTYDVVTNHPFTNLRYDYVANGFTHHNTGRASAQKGTGVPRANITFGKLKTKIAMHKNANGLISSVNVQGFPSKSYSLKEANKIIKMPDHIREQIEELNKEVESRLTILIRDA